MLGVMRRSVSWPTFAVVLTCVVLLGLAGRLLGEERAEVMRPVPPMPAGVAVPHLPDDSAPMMTEAGLRATGGKGALSPPPLAPPTRRHETRERERGSERDGESRDGDGEDRGGQRGEDERDGDGDGGR